MQEEIEIVCYNIGLRKFTLPEAELTKIFQEQSPEDLWKAVLFTGPVQVSGDKEIKERRDIQVLLNRKLAKIMPYNGYKRLCLEWPYWFLTRQERLALFAFGLKGNPVSVNQDLVTKVRELGVDNPLREIKSLIEHGFLELAGDKKGLRPNW